jgi:hypothetical protein
VERAYLVSTRAVSALLVVLGIAAVVLTIARGGGPLAVGVLVGAMLAAVGAGRLVLSRRQTERSQA